MFDKLAISAALCLAVGSASAQGIQGVSDGPGPNPVIEIADASGEPKGTITLDLYEDKAPTMSRGSSSWRSPALMTGWCFTA